MNSDTTRFAAALIAALCALGLARADTLITTSPFVAPGAPQSQVPTTTTDGPLQLSAIVGVGNEAIFGIYSPTLKRARFVKLNERASFTDNSPAFVVRSTRVVDGVDQVTVDYQGASMNLPLKQSKVASSTSATPGGGPAAAPRGGPAVTAAAVGPAAIQAQPRGGPGGPGGRAAPQPATPEQVAAAQAALAARQNQRAAATTGQTPATTAPAAVANPRGRGGAAGGGRAGRGGN